jgi:hypothetical protein
MRSVVEVILLFLFWLKALAPTGETPINKQMLGICLGNIIHGVESSLRSPKLLVRPGKKKKSSAGLVTIFFG